MGETAGTRLLGIHLEGPFLNPRRGGAQRTEWMRAPSIDELDHLQEAAAGNIRLLTAGARAPRRDRAHPSRAPRGIAVALGHSEASAEQVEAAIAAGATHVTHCFNAMAPLHHRDVGLVGMALTDDRLRIELIADGVHVERRALALAVRSKPAGGWILVSDGVAAVGQPPGPLRLFGAECVASDAVRQADSGRLAGSCLTLVEAVRNLRRLAAGSSPMRPSSKRPAVTPPPRSAATIAAERWRRVGRPISSCSTASGAWPASSMPARRLPVS